MKINNQKGFVAQGVLTIIALVLIGAGIYYFMAKNEDHPLYKWYTDTVDGYELRYPFTWKAEKNSSNIFRIYNPA